LPLDETYEGARWRSAWRAVENATSSFGTKVAPLAAPAQLVNLTSSAASSGENPSPPSSRPIPAFGANNTTGELR